MVLRIQCSLCGKKYKLSEKYAGRKVKCRDCDEPLPIPAKQISDSDAFASALDSVVSDDSAYQSSAPQRLPPRAVGSKQKITAESPGQNSTLTASKVYLIQGLVAGGMLGGGWSLGWSVVNFELTGWILLIINTVVGIVTYAIVGAVVMSAAGKFDSAFAGCVAGALVTIPINGSEAFVNQLLGNEMWPLYIYFAIGIPKGVLCALWIFKMAKDVEVKEA